MDKYWSSSFVLYNVLDISLSDDGLVLVVGTNEGNTVFVHGRSNVELQWTSKQTITGTNGFGYSVSLSGDGKLLVVGTYAIINIINTTTVYTRQSTTDTFSLFSTITLPSTNRFLSKVSGNGSVILLSYLVSNYVEVYTQVQGNWKRFQTISSSSDENFGFSSDISPDGRVAIFGTSFGNYARLYERPPRPKYVVTTRQELEDAITDPVISGIDVNADISVESITTQNGMKVLYTSLPRATLQF